MFLVSLRFIMTFCLIQSDLITWGKVFKNRPSKICGRQPLKNVADYITSNFLKAVSTNSTWSILEYFDQHHN